MIFGQLVRKDFNIEDKIDQRTPFPVVVAFLTLFLPCYQETEIKTNKQRTIFIIKREAFFNTRRLCIDALAHKVKFNVRFVLVFFIINMLRHLIMQFR